MSRSKALLWFRRDLRLADNPALLAMASQHNVVPIYIHSPEEEGAAAPGAASRWWLHHSLIALDHDLQTRGSRLILRQGSALATLQALCEETGATTVAWNRRYEPACVKRDEQLKTALREQGVQAHSFNSALLFEPWELSTTTGKPYTVFTPFWRACMAQTPRPQPQPAPKKLSAPTSWPHSVPIESLALKPRIAWDAGLARAWTPGEAGARKHLQSFIRKPLANYIEDRNRPDVAGTSRLSPHLHFGEIGPRQVFHAVEAPEVAGGPPRKQIEVYQSELGWREFAHHLLFHFPKTVSEPLNPAFAKFPWAKDKQALVAWQKGHTGYPLVDAGMRELWHTGFMHNRVRMVVASFLVKHLLLPWQSGAAWFWDTLVDADLANNTLGWQWTAGCGADASPFFRIFNPMLQSQKFDPHGHYIKAWLPELAKLPPAHLHKPWQAPAEALAQAKVVLGKTYPKPIVDHGFARERALSALSETKQAAAHTKARA